MRPITPPIQAVCALFGGYALFLTLAAFVDLDCFRIQRLHLVTALEEYARQDDAASRQVANSEAAVAASVSAGDCYGTWRRNLRQVGVMETLHIFYAARPLPGDVIQEKSIRDAHTLENRIMRHDSFDDHCFISTGSGAPDRTCSHAAVRAWTEAYFWNGELQNIEEATKGLARTEAGTCDHPHLRSEGPP